MEPTPKGRHRVISTLIDNGKFTLNIGSKETAFGDIRIDIDKEVRPDIVADANHLPFRDDVFDQVIFTDVIEHLPRGTESKALNEIYMVLRSNGKLILSTPNKKRIFMLLDPAFFIQNHRHYKVKDVHELLLKCKFQILNTFTAGFIWASVRVMWHCLIIFPSRKFLKVKYISFLPSFLQELEDKDYPIARSNDGWTIFVQAVVGK